MTNFKPRYIITKGGSGNDSLLLDVSNFSESERTLTNKKFTDFIKEQLIENKRLENSDTYIEFLDEQRQFFQVGYLWRLKNTFKEKGLIR